MSIHTESRTGHFVVRYRDEEKKLHTVTANEKNLIKYGVPFQPGKSIITIDHTAALEKAIINNNHGISYHPLDGIFGNADLSAVIKEYVESRPSKSVSRPKAALEHLLGAVGDMPLRYFKRKALDRFAKFVSAHEAFSSVTRHDYIADVKTFCNWLVIAEYKQNNPAIGLAVPPANPPRDHLNNNQIVELTQLIRNNEIESSVMGELNLGARSSELRNLQWPHIDFERNRVHIKGTKTSNADRWVPLFPDFKKYLLGIKRNNEYIFTTVDGMPLDKISMDTMLKRFKRNHLVSFSWDFRKLRRTYGSILLINGFPITTVSRFLGHDSVTTTERWYVHLTADDLFKTVPEHFHGINLKEV